jgi:RNA polymerase sigma-70 factor (ECF subfamily)
VTKAPAATIVARARDGDAIAWRELYEAHAGRLVLWLRQLPTGDASADHDDIAMDAWTIAASRIADFQGDDDDFGAWLFGIARNHVLNARRKSARRQTYPTDTMPEHADHTLILEPISAALEAEENVRLAIASLPRREGEVIACVDVVDLDVATTAQILGMSQAAVRMARRRGLTRLRKRGWDV